MNKLTIPAILVATVMVAGVFAFMPVEQASTVHQSVATLEDQTRMVTVTDLCTAGAANDCKTVSVDVATGASYQVLSIFVTEVDTTADGDIHDLDECLINGELSGADPAATDDTTTATFVGVNRASVAVAGNDFTCTDATNGIIEATDTVSVSVTMIIDADAADPTILVDPET